MMMFVVFINYVGLIVMMGNYCLMVELFNIYICNVVLKFETCILDGLYVYGIRLYVW